MSRSYKKPYDTMVPADKSFMKRQANKVIRRINGVIGNGAKYKRYFPQWELCDGSVYMGKDTLAFCDWIPAWKVTAK